MSTDLESLRARYGTPLYVYSLDQITENVRRLRSALPHPTGLYYSLKANPHPDLVAHLAELGCAAEVSSPGELRIALDAGFDPGACLYTGPAKTVEELREALDVDVRRFSVESAADYQRVIRAAGARENVECLIRVSQHVTGGAGLRMSGAATQFGIDSADLDLADFPTTRGVAVAGLHFFPLSNARDEKILTAEFRAGIDYAAKVRRAGDLELSVVDLGGGFAAPYATTGRDAVYPDLAGTLTDSLDSHLPGWRTGKPAVVFESGRHLVSSAGRLLTTVVEVKRKGSRTFVLLDTGIHHVGGLSGTGRLLPAATPVRADGRLLDDSAPVTLAGPLCTPADVLGREVELAGVSPGDLLVFPNTGAYGLTASVLGFLSRPTPIEVVLRGEQVCSVTRLELHRASHRTKQVDRSRLVGGANK